MNPFAHLRTLHLRDIIASVAIIAIMAVMVVWSILLNATDIVAGLLDHTGEPPRRSH